MVAKSANNLEISKKSDKRAKIHFLKNVLIYFCYKNDQTDMLGIARITMIMTYSNSNNIELCYSLVIGKHMHD